MKELTELKAMSLDELNAELINLRKEQFNLRMKRANGALSKTHVFAEVRKAIARIKTIMTEKGGHHGKK